MLVNKLKEDNKARIVEILLKKRKELYNDWIRIESEIKEIDDIVKSLVNGTKNV